MIFSQHLAAVSNQLMVREEKAEAPMIARARSYIAEHQSEELSLKEVARAVNTSAFYFCKMFKQATGLTFTDYLARVRVEKVKNLLLNPHKRVSEAAFEAGFQSLSQFNRVFKKIEGMSPSDFREQLHCTRPGRRRCRRSTPAARGPAVRPRCGGCQGRGHTGLPWRAVAGRARVGGRILADFAEGVDFAVGEKAERQQQFVHAGGGGDIVQVMLAARHGLGHERQGRLAGNEIVDQRIQAAMAVAADEAGRRRMARQPLVGGFAAKERKQLLERLVHQVDEGVGIAERRGRGRGAQEDLPLALDFGAVAVQRLQVPLLHLP